jgi:hypothetical protein
MEVKCRTCKRILVSDQDDFAAVEGVGSRSLADSQLRSAGIPRVASGFRIEKYLRVVAEQLRSGKEMALSCASGGARSTNTEAAAVAVPSCKKNLH